MKILFAASEVHPFAKTGGLGDVAGALPQALAALGHEVAIVLPLYPRVRRRGDVRTVVAEKVSCRFAHENRPFRLLRTELKDCPNVAVYLVENPWIFEAEEAFYGVEPGSYGDGHLRFLYFARALCEIPKAVDFFPSVFHLNDWQTALVAPLLRTVYKGEPRYRQTATVLTIHNLAYQGVFERADLDHAGIPGFLLAEGRLLEKGLGNLLAGGLRFADAVTTVSRSYAEEILGKEHGGGLEGLLQWRRPLLTGIVNGLDTKTWDPESDPHLPAHYTKDDFAGKARCKAELLQRSGLTPTDGPVFGVVSRLVGQKGLELVVPVMHELLGFDPSVRFVLLGSGEPELEQAFRRLAEHHPGRAAARLAFDAPFSSLVEAGSDFFLMPSLFEPCGLNQLISMRYGTPPIVRAVGGLKDTVTDATETTLSLGRATGFVFHDYSVPALAQAVKRALAVYRSPFDLDRMRRAGMASDWSWTKSAAEYIAVYEAALARRTSGHHLKEVLSGMPEEPIEVELPALAQVPEGYPRDSLTLIPFDPTTLFIGWELGGPITSRLFEALSEEQRRVLTYSVVLTEIDTGRVDRAEAAGFANQHFAAVRAGARYRAELWLNRPGIGSVLLLAHGAVSMPSDVRPREA